MFRVYGFMILWFGSRIFVLSIRVYVRVYGLGVALFVGSFWFHCFMSR